MGAASGLGRTETRMPFNVAANAMDQPDHQPVRREMRGPTGVDDILKAFEAERMAQPPIETNSTIFTPTGPPPTPPRMSREGLGTRTDPLSEFGIGSDAQSVGTDTTMNTEKRRGRRRAVAPQVGQTLNLNV
jgi:ribosomal protein S28E/S33